MGIPCIQNELKVGRATPLRDPDSTALGLEFHINMSTPQPIILSTPQPIILSTPQPIILSTPQPIILSTPQPIILSTPQPIILSTPQPIILSTPQPIILDLDSSVSRLRALSETNTFQFVLHYT